jgi:hypothetical protein
MKIPEEFKRPVFTLLLPPKRYRLAAKSGSKRVGGLRLGELS